MKFWGGKRNMNSLKFLHFSDIHLDAPFSSLGSKFAAEQRRRDLLEVLAG